jgi:phenylpropionate dioxygenase-like ring-hydroxylating dioxygenase large terminal subunit
MTAGEITPMLVRDDGFVPKERYLSRAFLDLEMDRLWPRVWQIACREEEIRQPGDYLEYTVGDQSILVVRSEPDVITAHCNACLHRGTRLAAGRGHFDDGRIQCRFHGWRYALDGELTRVVDREEFTALPDDLRLGEVRAERWGGFVFVNMDDGAEPLLDFLDPLPTLLAPYHLDEMRLRGSLSTFIPANWKVVVDAFNEAYHVQGTHPQLLPWTDDVSIEYEQFTTHAHYGRLPNSRRELRPSPRLDIEADDVDEGEILAGLVRGLGGAFLSEETALVDELRAADLPPGALLPTFQARRRELLAARGLDVSAFADEQLTSADDVFVFPNVVGPIYPGSAIVFRMRPDGLDPDRSIKDTWVLEWPSPAHPPRAVEPRIYTDWTARDWGMVTNQDYANMAEVQTGMKSRGFEGSRLNPRQESNVLHMHRVIDRYLVR